MIISGWGRYPKVDTKLVPFNDIATLQAIVKSTESLITRGMGRAYGDSALSAAAIVSTHAYNRMLAFDDSTGTLTCESGLTLAELLDTFVVRGWFIPVTPGTKFVSIGGAIASDVHGKNHHKNGSFSCCVESFSLLLANGEIVQCSRDRHADLFYATFGGMGLTGVILEVSLRLVAVASAYIFQKTIKCRNLDDIMRQFEHNYNWTYSVGWIDCLAKGRELGRSLLMLGEHAEQQILPPQLGRSPLRVPEKTKLTIPFEFPSGTLNSFSVKLFNNLYFAKSKDIEHSFIDYDSYFYPLDAIHHWNRIYGNRGFIQYQCVLPLENSYEGLKTILQTISASGLGSFLAVLKLFGEQHGGVLSFPMKGYTLALDFPMNRHLFPVLAKLDGITQNYGGRLYLTKDARMSGEFFENTYRDKSARFKAIRRTVDPAAKFQSLQSIRLGI